MIKLLASIVSLSALLSPCVGLAGTPQQFVTALYTGILHRAPDPGALQYWISVAQQPGGCAQAATGIAESPEAVNLTNTTGAYQLANDLYVGMLGRSPESLNARFSLYIEILNSGRNVAVSGFTSSPEFQSRCAAFGATPPTSPALLNPAVFDASWYLNHNPDLQAAFGSDTNAATQHWLNHGLSEGRQGSIWFIASEYLPMYGDLTSAFGVGNY